MCVSETAGGVNWVQGLDDQAAQACLGRPRVSRLGKVAACKGEVPSGELLTVKRARLVLVAGPSCCSATSSLRLCRRATRHVSIERSPLWARAGPRGFFPTACLVFPAAVPKGAVAKKLVFQFSHTATLAEFVVVAD